MSGKELGLVFGFLVAWLVLNRWVLPWLGVPTCMSGACRVPAEQTSRDRGPQRDDGGSAGPSPSEPVEPEQHAIGVSQPPAEADRAATPHR